MGVPTQIAQASGREQVRPAGGPHARSPAWVASLPSPSPRRSRQAPVSSTKWSTAGSLGQLVPEGREDFCHGFLPALLSPGPTVQAINVAAASGGGCSNRKSGCGRQHLLLPRSVGKCTQTSKTVKKNTAVCTAVFLLIWMWLQGSA